MKKTRYANLVAMKLSSVPHQHMQLLVQILSPASPRFDYYRLRRVIYHWRAIYLFHSIERLKEIAAIASGSERILCIHLLLCLSMRF